MENQDKKKELIIEAALKRFAHFGLTKTTMTEIANDLSLSKALLYYYFPDKLSLYCAVLNSILIEMEKVLKEETESANNSQQAVSIFLARRHEFLSRYYNLLDFTKITGAEIPAILTCMFNKAKSSEISTLVAIFEKGIKRGELHLEFAAEQTANLLILALKGVVFESLHSPSRPFFPEKEEFEKILHNQNQLARIFISGLECQPQTMN